MCKCIVCGGPTRNMTSICDQCRQLYPGSPVHQVDGIGSDGYTGYVLLHQSTWSILIVGSTILHRPGYSTAESAVSRLRTIRRRCGGLSGAVLQGRLAALMTAAPGRPREIHGKATQLSIRVPAWTIDLARVRAAEHDMTLGAYARALWLGEFVNEDETGG